ncbi:MAG: diguanylate cyclase [Kangiellaceae bacterium]|jgi:diguanylate cyclase (GGDEF)-like protein/PAS domain S-box-containing protein|nr:diguanylate cyclase [Kangiellaceae bacterium]
MFTLPPNLLQQALDNALDIVMITSVNYDDPGNNEVLYVNQAFVEYFGYQPEEIVGHSPRILHGSETSVDTRQRIRDAIVNGWPIHTEIVNYTKTGEKRWIDLKMVPLTDDTGNISHFLFIEREATERKIREEKLYQDATVDKLTNTFNRHHTYHLASQILEHSARYRGTLSAVMLDIDNFKEINDNHGHPTGDKVLQKLTGILKEQIRKSDVFGRVGGEEFFIMLPESPISEALVFCERIRNQVATADWHSLGLDKQVTISIGVTELFNDNLESLIAKTDKALYKAKEAGRNCVIQYQEQNS